MTPEREKYIRSCNLKERIIRHLIRNSKEELKKNKAVCNSYNLKLIGRKPFGYRLHIVRIKESKLMLNAYRHELARLKGMDRVVVPKKLEGYTGVAECSCGCWVLANYCPECGRRLLWEKVK